MWNLKSKTNVYNKKDSQRTNWWLPVWGEGRGEEQERGMGLSDMNCYVIKEISNKDINIVQHREYSHCFVINLNGV